MNSSVEELGWREPQAQPSIPGHVARGFDTNASITDTHKVVRQGLRAATAGEGAEPVGRIILATEGRTSRELPLKVGRVIIGRTVDNDLQVDSRFVSRHHCQIITGAEGSVIEDLNSTNGIFVQGRRVRRHNLNDGDVVVIGKHEIMYVDERLARARLSSTEAMASVPTLDKPLDDAAHTETVVDPDRAANRG